MSLKFISCENNYLLILYLVFHIVYNRTRGRFLKNICLKKLIKKEIKEKLRHFNENKHMFCLCFFFVFLLYGFKFYFFFFIRWMKRRILNIFYLNFSKIGFENIK